MSALCRWDQLHPGPLRRTHLGHESDAAGVVEDGGTRDGIPQKPTKITGLAEGYPAQEVAGVHVADTAADTERVDFPGRCQNSFP